MSRGVDDVTEGKGSAFRGDLCHTGMGLSSKDEYSLRLRLFIHFIIEKESVKYVLFFVFCNG